MSSVLPTYISRFAVILVVVMGVAFLGTQHASAQHRSNHTLVIPKLDGLVELDGRVDDAAWDQALSLPLVQHMPDFGEEPSERTEVLIGYTDDYLYAACRCYDRQSPTATSSRRNYFGGDSDWLVLILDTFNDNENALAFATSPTGSRTDAAVANDATGETPVDYDWNTVWDAATHQNDKGWFAEMRIPIASLRFRADDDQTVMGLITWRWRSRNFEAPIFPALPRDWGTYSAWKPSQAQKVVFEDLEPQPLLRVTPYLLGGIGQQSVLNGTSYKMQTDPTYDIGLDVKYGLTSNLTLDVTVNTDFAQVEADDQEVNLTRFPLFFPEKRQFFQERSSNFAFNFNGSDRLFYSRRIGLHDGQPVRILGGGRLVGRVGSWDVGVLNMQTGPETALEGLGYDLPSENFGVARLRRQVINPYSYVGTIVTSRIGVDGSHNVAYGVDGIFRVAGEDYLSLKWAQTFDDTAPAQIASLYPARIQLQWERRSYAGLSYDFRYDRAGEYYQPAVGFELRENYFRLGDRISYGWQHGSGSILERQQGSIVTEAVFRNADGSLESLAIGPKWEFIRRGGGNLRLGLVHHVEDLPHAFALSDDVMIPAGRHTFQLSEASLGTPASVPLRAALALQAGSFYDGRLASLALTPTWNVSRHLRLTGTYEINRVVFSERNEALTAHIGRVRLEVTPSVRYSVQAFVQYNSAGDVVVGNIRFRYNPREGNDLYLVFNEQLNTNRSMATPRLPLRDNRTVMLKYTYTFGW